ncbi:MAG: lepB [Solirubrobacterales bacterium]|nr:lepB [Solirubrobacterales bacterium]
MVRRHRPWSVVRTFAVWIAMGFTLAILLAFALPLAFGDRSYVVRSGSMTPTIRTGDVVVVKPIPALSANVGDIITFEDPHGRLISHRARWIHRVGNQLQFTTQGDANSGQEHWQVRADGRIGRVLYRVPKLGFGIVRLQTTAGRVGLIIVPALVLAASLLRGIWRRERDEEVVDALAA